MRNCNLQYSYSVSDAKRKRCRNVSFPVADQHGVCTLRKRLKTSSRGIKFKKIFFFIFFKRSKEKSVARLLYVSSLDSDNATAGRTNLRTGTELAVLTGDSRAITSDRLPAFRRTACSFGPRARRSAWRNWRLCRRTHAETRSVSVVARRQTTTSDSGCHDARGSSTDESLGRLVAARANTRGAARAESPRNSRVYRRREERSSDGDSRRWRRRFRHLRPRRCCCSRCCEHNTVDVN